MAVGRYAGSTASRRRRAKPKPTPLYANFLGFIAVAGADQQGHGCLVHVWLILLNLNPKVEIELQKPPRLFGDPSYVPTTDDVGGLVYLEAVLRKNLRLDRTHWCFNAKDSWSDTFAKKGCFGDECNGASNLQTPAVSTAPPRARNQ
ncbi:hypothetical protein PHYSODRAFT_247763 [Phytophthora sojae]|uniref:Uncharacterized protein n=1 Tax=Phytophthora sojae (strain P6497) TaxID=1094619 RepID=G4YY01_PHYSP|nr:hypothetical protein PHYSODRAFT_247763 [Phytophthora sojae]EGZ25704.1 hypothetical protein PHYSODRAFT_247763 [Phytophthora sojae]|eukprot:XP_009520992.1 hypothetical protein PHYSODRAFT_247763 [Phytophthora sojae]